MKRLPLIIFFLFSSFLYAQNEILKYNRLFIIIDGCDDAEDKEACFDAKASTYILNNLTDSLTKKLITKTKKDTIVLGLNLIFDKTGILNSDESKVYSSVDSTNKGLKYLASKFPNVKPPLDEFNNGVASYNNRLYGFIIDSTLTKLLPVPNYKPGTVPYDFLDKFPIFEGCETFSSNDDLRVCMNKKLNFIIQRKMRIDYLLSTVNLPTGINSIFLFFNINKDGSLILTNSVADHDILKSEGERLALYFPKAISPGYLKGEAVKTSFFLPIRFIIEGDKPINDTKKN